MIFKLKKLFNSSYNEIITGVSSVAGGVFGNQITISIEPEATTEIVAILTATSSIIFLVVAVLIIYFLQPKYNIHKKKFKDVFVEKLASDINNFADSNTSIIEANKRMFDDSKLILNFSKTHTIFKDELKTLNLVLEWLKKGADKKISFIDIMDNKGLDCIAQELANKVIKSIKVDKLKINTSIVEPGCVALIEKMCEYGLPIEHDFYDINGIEQARSLAGGENYSAALIPFSTIYLSHEKMRIIEKYKYLCPITWEEQMVIGKRNANGEFVIKKIIYPERGSGHYQLITMMENAEIDINVDNPIDLGVFKNQNDISDSVVFYQPVAEIFKEVKKRSEHWGYINNRPFPIDIILVVNDDDFGTDILSFQSLVIVLMAMMKSDLSKTDNFTNKLYDNKKYRVAFEEATDYFVDVLK